MSEFKGGFLGFSYGTRNPDGTYDLVHSSDLGIVRTSNGGRYDDNLLPTIQDKTTQVPGGDGTYYFGSFYTQKQFSLSIAYDNLTEEQVQKIKRLFGDKKLHQLIFDENPYKVYTVKATGTPQLKFIAFDAVNTLRYGTEDYESNTISSKDELYGQNPSVSNYRIYKGEGTLSFIAYNPFAHSRFKYLDDYNVDNIPEWANRDSTTNIAYNLEEWEVAAGLKQSTSFKLTDDKVHRVIDTPLEDGVMYYNPGDIEAPFRMKFMYAAAGSAVKELTIGEPKTMGLRLSAFTLDAGDYGFQINSKLNLIEGLDENGKTTGKVYNRFISFGDFFHLPLTDELTFLAITGSNAIKVSIEYDYLYY